MPLTNTYVLPIGRIPDLFQKIQDGQAPERFTNQLLKDWGFSSTNDRAFTTLLKSLGFLTADGKPTQRYLDYRDHSRSKSILGQGVREAYDDIFLIKEHPTAADRNAIEGKFKSYHNVSDHLASLMTKTFFSLLPLSDLSARSAPIIKASTDAPKQDSDEGQPTKDPPKTGARLLADSDTISRYICRRPRMWKFTMLSSSH
ncbi:DUF5343 domain-containing protein [Bradyrhizobium sp. Pa8]|uniref:DUF5343 domain-containing protein n=1 Tax=Bradyrhizobium sp. Pa8 TaxID=3386552 RepID=UPI00403F819A